MRIAAAEYCEQRGERFLLVWGSIPAWMVVDSEMERFISALSRGLSPLEALSEGVSGHSGASLTQEARVALQQLRAARVLEGRPLRPPRERIESLSVNVTRRCNLRCRFCYNGDPCRSEGELTAEEMIAALESVRRWTAKGAALALLGGEPLLEPAKTLALAEWGRRRGLRPIVSTNGLLVDRAFAEEAARIGLEVQVSLDGPTAVSHDAIRGAGTFDQAVRAVEVLVAAGTHTILSMVFHAGNAHEIPEYLRFARRLGVQEARFIPLKQIAGGQGFAAPDRAAVVRLVRDTLACEPELRALLGRDFFSILGQTCQTCSLRQGCGTGSQTLLLDADGAVYPCINLTGPVFAAGNVRGQRLVCIWQHSPVLKEVRRLARTDARTDSCARCCLRYWCMGGCRGETYADTGRVDAPSVTCADQRASILEMMWTLAGEGRS